MEVAAHPDHGCRIERGVPRPVLPNDHASPATLIIDTYGGSRCISGSSGPPKGLPSVRVQFSPAGRRARRGVRAVPTRLRSGRQELTLPAATERLRLRRAAVARLGGRGVAEANRHLERPALRRAELDPLADCTEAHAAVASHLHPDVADALGARDAVMPVPEFEGGVHLPEFLRRSHGAKPVRTAR